MTNPDIKERLRRQVKALNDREGGKIPPWLTGPAIVMNDALSHIEALEITLGLKERMLSTCETERAELQQRINDLEAALKWVQHANVIETSTPIP